VTPAAPAPPARYWWPSLRLALGTASALGLARFAYGLLVPAMRDDLGWSLTVAGLLSTVYGLGYLGGALATTAVAGRLGTARTFRAGMVLTALTLAATAASGDRLPLAAARTAAGFAGALVFITGGVIASRLATAARSTVPITVYFAGAGLGIVASGAAVPPLLDRHAERWPLAWLGLAAAAGVAALISWTAARTGGDADAPAAGTGGRRRVRPLWRVAAAYLLFAAGYIAYITFLAAYLVEQHAPAARVAVTWAVLGLAVVAAPVLWARPMARWAPARALAALLAVLGAAAALPLLSPGAPVLATSAVAYGATFMVVPAAVTALIRVTTPPADWTRTLAAFTALFATGQTAGPWIAGALADRTSSAAALAWTAALCAGGAALAAVQPTAQPIAPPIGPDQKAPGQDRPGPVLPRSRKRAGRQQE
jgi:predicted MFS family arabinose efflux permease